MDYLPRPVDGQIDALLTELPAIFITGPRATGKTTAAARRAATMVRLDREAEAVAVRADPDAALRGLREPILLDEWQVMPGVHGSKAMSSACSPATPSRSTVAGAVLGLDADLMMREGDLLGRLLDTFVVAQLRAELAVTAARPSLYHVRQQQCRLEVDLLAELVGGRLVAIEVKADAAPSPDAGRHLGALRDRHPETFTVGVVLHSGPRTSGLGDRIVAAPISSLWG